MNGLYNHIDDNRFTVCVSLIGVRYTIRPGGKTSERLMLEPKLGDFLEACEGEVEIRVMYDAFAELTFENDVDATKFKLIFC